MLVRGGLKDGDGLDNIENAIRSAMAELSRSGKVDLDAVRRIKGHAHAILARHAPAETPAPLAPQAGDFLQRRTGDGPFRDVSAIKTYRQIKDAVRKCEGVMMDSCGERVFYRVVRPEHGFDVQVYPAETPAGAGR